MADGGDSEKEEKPQESEPPRSQQNTNAPDNNVLLREFSLKIKSLMSSLAHDRSLQKKEALRLLKAYHPDKIGVAGFGVLPQSLFSDISKLLTEYL